MNYQTFQPNSDLESLIICYWTLEVPAESDTHRQRIIPDGTIEMAFILGDDIKRYTSENEFVGAMSSYFMREPSNKMVETIEDCVLWEFEHQNLEVLFSTNQELEKVGRLFANYGMSLMEKRFDNLHFNTAKERYDILIKQQPEILLRISLGMIASYLGVTQETLSRIRTQQ